MIAIIDGCGANIASVQFALERLGKKSELTTDINFIQSASHVIIPGVGTAKQAMAALKKSHLIDVIRQLTQPVLGICLGMQILYDFSDEGHVDCLSLIPGKITSLQYSLNYPVPHMGWNQLRINNQTQLTQGIKNNEYVYFVHSFAAPINEMTIAVADHSMPFVAIAEKNNFYGVQFHPERSGKIGEQLLKNFLGISK